MYAAAISTSDETAVNSTTCAGVTSPRGSARTLVRGIGRIEGPVGPSVETHGGRPRPDHGHRDPEERTP